MPRFDHLTDADDAVLAHPLSDALARYLTGTEARYLAGIESRSVTTPERASGRVLLADRPATRVDPDELWDRLGDFA
jgi:hypothetical protein